MSNLVLVCIDRYNLCYFSTNLEKAWGDDWDDAPYQYNAGPPYEYEKVVFALFGDYETPSDTPGWSVEKINKKYVPWLYDRNSGASIWAGTQYDDFVNLIKSANGRIFIEG